MGRWWLLQSQAWTVNWLLTEGTFLLFTDRLESLLTRQVAQRQLRLEHLDCWKTAESKLVLSPESLEASLERTVALLSTPEDPFSVKAQLVSEHNIHFSAFALPDPDFRYK